MPVDVERVVFGTSMEGLWRALQPCTAAELAAFSRAGVKGERFDAAYPLDVYSAILDACAQSRYAGLDELERFTRVGRLFIDGYANTLVGQALLGLLRVLGPRRALERTTRNIRTANNYTEATMESVSPVHHMVRVNYVARTGFYRGILETMCARAGAREVQVRVVEERGESRVYEVKWAA